jgi:hypothetical protein
LERNSKPINIFYAEKEDENSNFYRNQLKGFFQNQDIENLILTVKMFDYSHVSFFKGAKHALGDCMLTIKWKDNKATKTLCEEVLKESDIIDYIHYFRKAHRSKFVHLDEGQSLCDRLFEEQEHFILFSNLSSSMIPYLKNVLDYCFSNDFPTLNISNKASLIIDFESNFFAFPKFLKKILEMLSLSKQLFFLTSYLLIGCGGFKCLKNLTFSNKNLSLSESGLVVGKI